MLANCFLTSEKFGLTETERDALIVVLGMLERGELEFHDVRRYERVAGRFMELKKAPERGFNMGVYIMPSLRSDRGDCGTTACIAGWANMVSNGKVFHFAIDNDAHPIPPQGTPLYDLFYPGLMLRYQITPEIAALALRNFLTTGNPRWDEVCEGAEGWPR